VADIMNRLAEIEARANAATEGPWSVDHDSEEVYADTCVATGDYGWIAVGPSGQSPHYDEDTAEGRADAEFIAHAREDVPALVAALRAVLAEVTRFRAAADANEPIAANGGWQASGYMKAYRRAAERLEDAIESALGGPDE
jgi:hypothetical protein